MKSLLCLILPLCLCIISCVHLAYPPTKTVDASDTYFRTTYKDPYRRLEDLKDSQVQAWFKSQADLTDNLLAKIPGRNALIQEWFSIYSLNSATMYSAIKCENGRVFYKKTSSADPVGWLLYREGWDGEEHGLFDPATYRIGVQTTIENIVPSPDGRFVILCLSSGGAEYSEIRILDVDRYKLLPESMFPSPSGGIAWTLDSKSFFYVACNTTDLKSLDIKLNLKAKLHKLGTDSSVDIDFFSNAGYPELSIAPREIPGVFIDESYPDYVFGYTKSVQKEMRIYYAPISEMSQGKINWKILCKPSDNLDREFFFAGEYAYAITHTDAPNYKVVRTSVQHPDWSRAETVIPEGPKTISYIDKSKNFMFIVYSDGILGSIIKYDLASGKSDEIKLPEAGSVNIECPDWQTDKCLVRVVTWTHPMTLYDFNAKTDTFTPSVFKTVFSYPGFENLVAEEVEVPGHDGVMVPLSIIYQKGIPLDGNNCCILEGYGAYGRSATPFFTTFRSIALRGVVLAIAHPRGGGEKGEAWYRAGYKTTKPNTWKDFISCAEYLIKKGYTSPQKLAGTGTSAGGILISRAITERPDLFAAAVCNVGCANAMRLEFSPNGPANIPEFGTVNDPVECRALYEMDGVQHVQRGVEYPAVLCVAGWNDARVAPWQPGKFAAALQNSSKSDKPVLLKVNYNSGHFMEGYTSTRDWADLYTFMLWQTGHKDFQPKP